MTDELEIHRIAAEREKAHAGQLPIDDRAPSGQGCALLFVGLLALAVTVVLAMWLG